jgi:hypothetical protein
MTDEIPQEPSRRVLLRNGLLTGLGIATLGIAAPVLTGTGTAQAGVSGTGEQPGWSWCHKCQALFYGIWQAYSHCPADNGQHDNSQSLAYYVPYGAPSQLVILGQQADWAWCYKCQGLFYGPFQGYSRCPADYNQHNNSQSGNYDMGINGFGSTGYGENICQGVNCIQLGWLWCHKCQGTFYGPWQSYSHCPEGQQHDGSQSAYFYSIPYTTG